MFRHFITGLSIFCLIILPLPVEAESVNVLTLEEAIRIAVDSNPDFQAFKARLGISEAAITTAGALPNPSFVTDNGGAEKTYRFGLQQTFLLGGDRKKRLAVAQAKQEVLFSEISQALLNLRGDVRKAYTQLYNAQERQAAYQQLLNLSQQLLNVAQKREKAGDIAQVDVLQTQLLMLEAQNDLRSTNYDLMQAKNQFALLLNHPDIGQMELAPPKKEPDVTPVQPSPSQIPTDTVTLQGMIQRTDLDSNQLVELALSRRPEVQRNLHMQAVTRRQEALAKAERIPDLTVAAGPNIITEPGQQEINVFVVASLEIPVFNRQQGPIEEAQARRTQLEQDLHATRNRITLEVKNAYTAYQRNQALIEQYESQLLPTAQILVEKAHLAFEEGKTSILFPINAQQAYVKTRLGYLQTLQNYQQAITDLEKAIGSGL